MQNISEGYSQSYLRLRYLKKTLFYFAFSVPVIVYVFVLSIVPAGTAVYDSFLSSKGTLTLANYQALPGLGIYSALIDTAIVSIGALVIQLFFALGVASIMVKPFRGNKAFSIIAIIPFGVSTVVSAFVFSLIFQAYGGFANAFLNIFGFHVDWFATKYSSLGVVMFSDFWKNTPLIALILYGGLSSISPSIFEAAAVDGAGPFSRFIHITLPNIAPLMAIALLVRGVSEFNIFALPLVIIGYTPKLMNTLIYENYSFLVTRPYSYAIAVVLLAIILAYAVVVLRLGGASKYVQ